ncbi:hypothetical protein DITRI_Ditri13aG0069900 [Diplodiscus trichospermus]
MLEDDLHNTHFALNKFKTVTAGYIQPRIANGFRKFVKVENVGGLYKGSVPLEGTQLKTGFELKEHMSNRASSKLAKCEVVLINVCTLFDDSPKKIIGGWNYVLMGCALHDENDDPYMISNELE